MKRIPKQRYTAMFEEQAVKRADEVGSIARVEGEKRMAPQATCIGSLVLSDTSLPDTGFLR